MSVIDAPRILGVGLKMYLDHRRQRSWLSSVRDEVAGHPPVSEGAVGVFVLPTFPSLPTGRELLRATRIEWGAQDIAAADSGPYTGEVSGIELAELGCRFVELGHAERRAHFGESDELVSAKAAAAFRNDLVPVICVGERERTTPTAAGIECVRQLHATLRTARAAGELRPFVIAYEPVWAIGAADPAPAEYVIDVATRLRDEVGAGAVPSGSRVIYGGSARAGIWDDLAGAVDGLFLGRSAHDVSALRAVIDELAHGVA